jgi:hypothetical protein
MILESDDAVMDRQTATFSQRQSTREENFVLAGISLKEPVCGVYAAQNRDGQFLGVRPCEAHTSINLTSDLTIVRSKLPTFRGPPVMDGSNILLALSPMWRSACGGVVFPRGFGSNNPRLIMSSFFNWVES